MAGYVRRATRRLYENPWVALEAHEIVHPNGVVGEHALVRVPPASGVVALDGTDVILTEQSRYAIGRRLLEIVKGGAHPGEDPLACARREAHEEIGLIAQRWLSLGKVYEIPSIVEGAIELFLARDCRFVACEPERVESIRVVRLPLGDAVRRSL